MKRLARFLAGFYPRRWRARYGAEFDALLDDAELTWRDLLDLASAALLMRMRPWPAPCTRKGEDGAMDNQLTTLRIIDLLDRDVPHGYELQTVIEHTHADGSQTVTRQFFRELDFGDSYLTIQHLSRGSEAARTFVVSGSKGQIEGDFRTDRTEMTVLNADGSVGRSEQTVKTWMKTEGVREKIRRRYREGLEAGLSPDQIYQNLRLENQSR